MNNFLIKYKTSRKFRFLVFVSFWLILMFSVFVITFLMNLNQTKVYYADIVLEPTKNKVYQRIETKNINETNDRYFIRVIDKMSFSEGVFFQKEITKLEFQKFIDDEPYADLETKNIRLFVTEYMKISNPKRLYYDGFEDDPFVTETK